MSLSCPLSQSTALTCLLQSCRPTSPWWWVVYMSEVEHMLLYIRLDVLDSRIGLRYVCARETVWFTFRHNEINGLSSSSSLGSRCVPWLGEGLSMLSPNYPVLCFPLPYRVAPVFVQVVSPSLGWSPLSSFLVIWSPTGDTRGPSVVFETVDMPCPGPFHLSYSVDYIYDFCPLPDPDVGLSVFVCDVEHTSFHFCLCGRKFVLCLFGQCPCLCTICHSWQHTGVVHLSL